MSQGQRNLDKALESIVSRTDSIALETVKNEPGGSIRSIGSPTNNMLLSSIAAECRRTSDSSYNIERSLIEIKASIDSQSDAISQLADSISQLANAISSNSGKIFSQGSEISTKTKDHYFKGIKLSSKYHIYACIVSHLMSMVFAHMQKRGILYSDSVDCDFNELVVATRVVCTSECSVPSINFRSEINATTKSKPVIDTLYRYISSGVQSNSVSLPESNISRIYNDSTREDIFVHVERIMHRLSILHGVLSPKQMEALKSFNYPIVISEDNEELRLNLNSDEWKASRSHEISNSVTKMNHDQRCRYIKQLLHNKTPNVAYKLSQKQSSN